MRIQSVIFIIILSLLLYFLLSKRRQLINRPICNGTIVTAYYKIRSKFSHEQYVDWMSNMLTLRDCMVIFTQPELVG